MDPLIIGLAVCVIIGGMGEVFRGFFPKTIKRLGPFANNIWKAYFVFCVIFGVVKSFILFWEGNMLSGVLLLLFFGYWAMVLFRDHSKD